MRRSSPSSAIRRSLPLLLLWLLTFMPAPTLAQSSGEPLPLARYLAEVATAEELLAQPDGAARLRAVQQTFVAVRQIELPSGTIITPPPLLGDPAEEEIELATARLRLATIQDELAAAPNDETAARLLLLAAIFQQPEFVERDSLWQRFWRWLRSWLPTMESNESSAGASGVLFQWLGWALIGVGALLLIWLLSYWLQNLLGTLVGGVERQHNNHVEIPQSAAAARTSAHKLADAGSYREAVRHLYLSALLTLHERNLLTYQPSDTNREVLTAVRNQPLLYQQLQPVVATFDDVWYGVHEPDRTSFDSYVVAVEKLEEVN